MTDRVFIDAERAKDSICECYITEDEKLMLIRRINRLPAADVVARDCYDRLLAENDRLRQERPVVHCRDCKHYDCEDGDQKCVKDAEWVEEDACYYGFISYHGPEFFCADGERKDGGQDDGH